jgi:hypothetical protein
MKADYTEPLGNSPEVKEARIAELEEANKELAMKIADLENHLRMHVASLESELARERAMRTWRTDHPPIHQLILAVIEYSSRGKVKLERIVCRVDEDYDLWSESGNNLGYQYKPWFTRFVKWMPLPEIVDTQQR